MGLPGDFYEEVTEVTANNQAVQREVIEFGQQAATREAAGDAAGALNARIAQQIASNSFKTPWKGLLKGLGIGLAAGVVNFGIDQWSNSFEDRMHKGSRDEIRDSDELDENNNIGIIATDV